MHVPVADGLSVMSESPNVCLLIYLDVFRCPCQLPAEFCYCRLPRQRFTEIIMYLSLQAHLVWSGHNEPVYDGLSGFTRLSAKCVAQKFGNQARAQWQIVGT